MSSTLWSLLSESARRNPSAPSISAVRFKDLTYAALLAEVHAAVERLNRFGFGRSDRIAVVLPPGPHCPVALISVMCGCICIPLNPAYSEAELESIFRKTQITGVLTIPRLHANAVRAAERANVAVIELEPTNGAEAGRFALQCRNPRTPVSQGPATATDIAAIFVTSGTTSQSKLVPLRHSVVCYRARLARHYVQLTPSDRCLDLLPCFHGGAVLISILGSLAAGASIIYTSMPGTQDFISCIHEAEPTWCAVPPPFVEKLAADDTAWPLNQPPSYLRALFTCGAPVSADTAARLEQALRIPLQNSYGASECGGVTAIPMPPGLRKRGSVGVSIGPELAVFDEEGTVLPPGEIGEIVVRGPGVFDGYENAGIAREGTFAGDWYRTGDRGFLDEDGYLFLTGRLRETINRGGEKILPEEIENVLRSHPNIENVVAFPIPDALLGQDVAALVTTRGATEAFADLRQFAAQQLAAFKVPRVILFVKAIPLGPAGKVQRNQLAGLFREELAAALRTGPGDEKDLPRHPVERALVEIWGKILSVDHVGVRDRFFDLGGNSLLAVNMLSEVEKRFGRTVPAGPFWHSPTVENLAAIVTEAERRKSSLMLPIQISGSSPPLFYVLPGWFVSEVELVSRYLGPEHPVYAMIPDPRPGGAQCGMSSEEIVAECVAAIESVSSAGRCSVIGRSAGGLLALEIARQLRAKGRNVTLVGMLDTHYPGVTRQNLLPTPLKNLEFVLGQFTALPRSEWSAYLRSLPARAIRRTWRRLRGKRRPAQQASAALYTRLERVFETRIPDPWLGTIVMFAAESSRHRGFIDRRLYWSRVAKHGLEVHLVPGDHNMMVQEPHVGHFAATLKGCLDRAEGENAWQSL